MSARPPGGGAGQAPVLILTALCGLAGGLLAVRLLDDRFTASGLWAPLLIVSGSAVLATAVAFLLLTATPAATRRPPAGPPAPQRPWYQASAQQGRPAHRPPAAATPAPAAADPVPRTNPGHLVLPLEDGAAPAPEPGGGQWWTKSAPAAAAADRNSRAVPALSSYVADGAALVAQCPNCGDFHIDVRRAGPAYVFRCRNPRCGEEWRWTPGTAWPPVVVRRNLTGHERG